MKNLILAIFVTVVFCGVFSALNFDNIYAADEKKETIPGECFYLEKKAKYDFSGRAHAKKHAAGAGTNRFYVEGNISEVGKNNGFVSYAVKSGNLKIKVDKQFAKSLVNGNNPKSWHIITDQTQTVYGRKLLHKIGTGAIIIQTSKNGKTWIDSDEETDIFKKWDDINNRVINGEKINAYYKTNDVQLTNGCYYRIIVAFKIKKEISSSKVLLFDKKNYQESEFVEVYKFYAYDPSVDREETLNPEAAYEFNDVKRVDSEKGFANPKQIAANDPHNDAYIGRFYISGYTSEDENKECPTFLKVPGDKMALWFYLEQPLNKCFGRTDVKVNDIKSGSDSHFGTPTIDNFGKGALIVRKRGKKNHKERQIYTNYLEASATVGANTRIDLFEEGDYEVALDYQLHYDKPFVFGTKTTKTLSYQMLFRFNVRNGDISAFIRDIDTKQFLNSGDIAEHGFYIDLAKSKYLKSAIRREVLSDSIDGLVEDPQFDGIAVEGRKYTDEGIYTVTVENPATGRSIEKRVYVGNSDVLIAHMKTGLSISEIKEKLASGAYVDEDGQIIETEQVLTEANERETEAISESVTETESDTKEELNNVDVKKEAEPNKGNVKTVSDPVKEQGNSGTNLIVLISIIFVLGIGIGITVKKKTDNKIERKENDEK